jgi:hypothetical protein
VLPHGNGQRKALSCLRPDGHVLRRALAYPGVCDAYFRNFWQASIVCSSGRASPRSFLRPTSLPLTRIGNGKTRMTKPKGGQRQEDGKRRCRPVPLRAVLDDEAILWCFSLLFMLLVSRRCLALLDSVFPVADLESLPSPACKAVLSRDRTFAEAFLIWQTASTGVYLSLAYRPLTA